MDSSQASAARFQDTDAQAAARALAEGRPWEASRILVPVLRDSTRRTPEVVLLAASAAAGWGGWAEVDRMLRAEPWLDSYDRGEGRFLLARAAFEQRQDSVALRHLRLAVPRLAGDNVHPLRVVMLARVLDRLDQRDSARIVYARAAQLYPMVAEWLHLRAAGVTEDSAVRAAAYRLVRGEAARQRVRWTEAQARERVRDFQGAAQIYASLGAHATALRLRYYAAADSVERGVIRRELLTLIGDEKRTSDEARTAIEILDLHFAPLTPNEELVVARRSANTGPAARADRGFAKAFSARLGTERDRFEHASVLFRLGRYRDAATQFAKVVSRPYAGQAAYQRARSLLRAGQGDAARSELERVRTAFASDTAAAALALYLLADLATDNDRDAEARTLFRELVRRYPTSTQAPEAAFRAALIAFISGDARTAGRELDTLALRKGPNSEVLAAMYWSGRARWAAGDTSGARQRWRAVIARDPLSYYSLTSARRLGEAPWAPRSNAYGIPRIAEIDSAMARFSMLDQIGMPTEARFELDRLTAEAPKSAERLLATAFAMNSYDEAPRGIRLAGQFFARDTGRRDDAALFKVVYPFAWYGALRMESARRNLDFALVAAIIRQESSFNPRAVSPAGAVGLMQLMPGVARELARSLNYPLWDNALLFQPDVNVQLGVIHFAGSMRRYDELAHALAAYNAGGTRVARWLKKAGASDPEIFIERIPYTETRDYVRIVERNRAMYEALYPAGDHLPVRRE